MESEKVEDSNYISLYDVASVVHEKKDEINELIYRHSKKLERKIKQEVPKCQFLIYGLDYSSKELAVGIDSFGTSDYQKVILKKSEDDLYIEKSETFYNDDLLFLVGNELSEVYDELSGTSYQDFYEQKVEKIDSQSSSFEISIDSDGVVISSSDNDFRLSSVGGTYRKTCNSNLVHNRCFMEKKKNYLSIFI